MQIAADVSVIPLDQLYRICSVARECMTGEYAVGRVIARPFVHENGRFIRTEDRKDYALEPPGETMLDVLYRLGISVTGVGKISDIFCGRGIGKSIHTGNNVEGLAALLRLTGTAEDGLVFVNLVDTDMLYGHRNNTAGYAEALQQIDEKLSGVFSGMRDDDVLIITADHGCDPTTVSTDHSREYVPLLIYGEPVRSADLKTMNGFDHISDFVLACFSLKKDEAIYDRIIKEGFNG